MKNNKYYFSSSKRRTPWDGQNELSPTQKFIKDKYIDNYYSKHTRIAQTNESEFLNTIKVENCRCCNSSDIKKSGFTGNGVQRYYCNSCHKTFNVLTNTIFDNHKLSIFEWIEYLLNIFGYVSFSSTSRNSKTSKTTAKYWLIKLFFLLENYQDSIILKDTVWIDETFVREKSIKLKDDDMFPGDRSYCIGIGYDKVRVYARVQGKSTVTSKRWTYDTFIDHIQRGSVLIHDQERSHSVLYEPLNLISKAYNAKKCKDAPDSKNPLTPINEMCSLLKSFLRAHQGFNRDELQDYLNLFAFMMNPPYNKLEKIEYLINCGLSSTISVKYRSIFSK